MTQQAIQARADKVECYLETEAGWNQLEYALDVWGKWGFALYAVVQTVTRMVVYERVWAVCEEIERRIDAAEMSHEEVA